MSHEHTSHEIIRVCRFMSHQNMSHNQQHTGSWQQFCMPSAWRFCVWTWGPYGRALPSAQSSVQALLSCFTFRFTNYSTSNAMSSAWSPLPSSSATVHGTGPLLQSTAAANIIFINIDWKRERHANAKSTKKFDCASRNYIWHSH